MPPDDDPGRLKRLEDRIDVLEVNLTSLQTAYSRSRYQARRFWLRPPLWTFEQYSPRAVRMKRSYALATASVDAPKIAIVTPSYNQCEYLGHAIDSVLSQDYPHLSYYVQDADSPDGSVDLLKRYGSRINWRSERDAGQAQGINRGFAEVEGDIMAYLNSDDMLLPGTLAYVAGVFEKRPDVDLVYGHRVFVDGGGHEIGRAVLPAHDEKALYWADYLPQETLFWRRRVWEAVGPFDETFNYALDWDFILRAQEKGFKFFRVPRFLACFRVHDQQKTASLYEIGRREMQVLRKRYLGHEPAQAEIVYAISRYLGRQLAMHWMYKLGVLRP